MSVHIHNYHYYFVFLFSAFGSFFTNETREKAIALGFEINAPSPTDGEKTALTGMRR